ncbi:MAG: hypothetical protein AMXMBFR13_25610 [Phycisphaerae bacterium]
MARMAVVALSLTVGSIQIRTAWAQTVVDHLLALGGDNHADQIIFDPPYYPAFTPGSELDGQQFTEGDIITWDVRVLVSGIHVVGPGELGDGLPPNGAAGLSFDLELHAGTADGPLAEMGAGSASSEGWFSTVFSTRNAAFCSSFDIGAAGSMGGHVYDRPVYGGPGLRMPGYPSARGRPADALTPLGKLESMAIVGLLWGGETDYVPGVGVPLGGLGGCAGGLGVVPLFEGQINTTGMEPGTYVLKVVPRRANLYHGAFNGAGAVPFNQIIRANETRGDTITFELLSDPPPVLTGAVSRLTHGAATVFDIDLPLDPAATAGVECRHGGPSEIALTFSEPIAATDGTPDATEVSISDGTLDMVTIDGSELLITMTGVPDQSCLVITLSGIADLRGHGLSGDSNVHVRVLEGDVNADGVVASGDITQVKSHSGQLADSGNFRCDLNWDGVIGSADITQVKLCSGHTVSCE